MTRRAIRARTQNSAGVVVPVAPGAGAPAALDDRGAGSRHDAASASSEARTVPGLEPLVTFVIPCYNSAAYLGRSVDPLLAASRPLEVVLVDDGSTDATADLVDRYAEEHPGIVHAVHQPNGGHGAAITAGIRHARGLYVKVLDSDDWVASTALEEYLGRIEEWVGAGVSPDAVITNYVYENLGHGIRKVVRYRSAMPTGTVCGWSDLRRPRTGSYFLMHALTYRTDVLRRSGVTFPCHTFYVDNLMASIPLRQVRTLAYLDVDLYRYVIGRHDQSVAENVMVSRLDDQLRVNRLLVDSLRSGDLADPVQRRYLLHYASIVSSVSLTLTVLARTDQARRDGEALLAYMRDVDPDAHRAFRRTPMGMLLAVPGRSGDLAVRLGYRLARRRFGFN